MSGQPAFLRKLRSSWDRKIHNVKNTKRKALFLGEQCGGEGRGFAACSADSKGVRDTQGTQPLRQDDAQPPRGTEDGAHETPRIRARGQGWVR